ncbi:right-handed parallel beta-helix repeat-containing protein [Kiritimatiellaeota bacterium B1221]|nr:right-handed parallel beta-helix repeat-containing protein [Kiritimatiellaeota bacterium B1221]
MKLIRICLFSIFSTFALSSIGEELSLLKNGDFSMQNESGDPVGWKSTQGKDLIAVVEGDHEKYTKVLQVTVGEAQKSQGQVLQRFNIKVNHMYRLSGAMKSSNDRSGFFQVKLYKDKKELSRQSMGRSGKAWKTYSGEFYAGDADMAEVLLRYYRYESSVGNTVQFADVSFVDLGEKVFVPPAVESAEVVTTFSSAGLWIQLTGDAGKDIQAGVRYREVGSDTWQQGLDLIYIPSEKQFRGSLLNLKEGAAYEVVCRISDPDYQDGAALEENRMSFKTWTREVPVAKTIQLPAGVVKEPLVISDQGTAEGWIRYVGHPDGTVLETGKAAKQAVRFEEAAYVLFEHVTVRGGQTQGVVVTKSHHIRIRHCDIANWGDPGEVMEPLIPRKGLYVDKDGKRINWQAGVMIASGASQVVVENNFIHAPNGTANSWQYGHPLGPQGVIMNNSEGNHVIRYNDIVGSEGHWWNDGIESMWNTRIKGGPYRDTDIYGNLIAFSNDDGTELDGGQMNVRYFNNWIQWAFCGISCAPNMAGPSYVFRNVFVLGDERNQVNFGFKMGGSKYKNQGLSLLFHNTVISSNAGLSTGHFGTGSSPIWSRNNAVHARVAYLKEDPAKEYDLDYDLVAAGSIIPDLMGNYENAVWSVPQFVDAESGDYRLQAGSPGVDQAKRIPGINDDFEGVLPDMGAYENGEDFTPVPVRPDGLYFVPAFVGFESGASASELKTIRLKAPASLGSGWEVINQTDWLKITPASGVTGDADQMLQVDMGKAPEDLGLHRGSFTIRTTGGYFRTMPVEVLVRPENPVRLVLEAEDAEVTGRYLRFEDEVAGGGAYLEIPYQTKPSLRFKTSDDADSELKFTFKVPEDGLYYISGNVMVPGPDGPNRDSMFMALNDAVFTRWNLTQAGRAEWNVQRLQGGSGSDGMAFALKAGEHVLRLRPREVGNRIDYLIISNER